MNPRVNELGLPVGPALDGWRAPPRPHRTVLHGRYCRVEPLEVARHAAGLFAAHSLDREGRMWTYLQSGPFATLEDYRTWLARRAAGEDPLFYAFVEAGGQSPVGLGAYLRIDPENGSVEIGHLQYSPLLQRTTAATEAMYLMMRHAFELGYRRCEWKCDALNERSQRAAERLGFRFEGVFRQATVYKGRSRDTAWYSIIDSEWPAVAAGLQAWLDPANFDGSGTQRTTLAEARRRFAQNS